MYELNDDDIAEQYDGLPAEALAAVAEVRATLEVAPWSGESINVANPDAEVRFMTFTADEGSGFIYYLVLEGVRRVDLLGLVWLG